MVDVFLGLERSMLDDALRGHEVVARGERWLCIRVAGEPVTVGPVGEEALEIIAPVCREHDLTPRDALALSRSLAWGALVLAEKRYCLRQVVPLRAFVPGDLLGFIHALVSAVHALRGVAAKRRREAGRPFAGYAT